jgi:hypothetical protein
MVISSSLDEKKRRSLKTLSGNNEKAKAQATNNGVWCRWNEHAPVEEG